MIKNKKLISIGLIALLIIIVFWMLGEYRGEEIWTQVKKEKAITVAKVVKFEYPTKGTEYNLFYNFNLEGKTYEHFLTTTNQNFEKLIQQSFPIIFYKKNPEYNQILITQDDFKKYDLSYPDSIKRLVDSLLK